MKGVRELNLEQGRPSVDRALGWLEAELEAARKMNTPLMKLIHGYGSSGKGGRIRTASRRYLEEAAAQGLVNLKGHRIVGGMRASIYNAMPVEGVQKLVDFMKQFETEN